MTPVEFQFLLVTSLVVLTAVAVGCHNFYRNYFDEEC